MPKGLVTIKSVKKKRMYKMVAEELMRYIAENNMQPGDVLLSEIELSQRFGVSRTSVREGIIYLETLGIVSPDKHGAVVNETNFRPVTDHLHFGLENDFIVGKELVDARKMIEIGALDHAIDYLDESHFSRMERNIDRSKIKVAKQLPTVEEDLEFHQIIMEAANNQIVEKFCVVLREFFQYKPSQYNPGIDELTIVDHETIYAHLKHKDRDRAIAVMKRHFEPLYGREYLKQAERNKWL